jgi:hypothetical protein
MSTVANIKVQPMNITWGGSALGFTDGDLEVTFVEDLVDVTAHQEGTNVLSAIRTGKSVEISVAIKETTTTNVKLLYGAAGTIDNASGATAQVVGWGSAKDFTQVLAQAGKLVFHPVVNAANNYNEDIAFWKAYPVPGSFVFSGENPSILNVTFRCFPDSTKATAFRLGIIGNHVAGNFSQVGA